MVMQIGLLRDVKVANKIFNKSVGFFIFGYLALYIILSFFFGGYAPAHYGLYQGESGVYERMPKKSAGLRWFFLHELSGFREEGEVSVSDGLLVDIIRAIYIPVVIMDNNLWHRDKRWGDH